MKMSFKKEVKHSVVYETEEAKAPVRSVYVSKDWLRDQSAGRVIPRSIEVEVKAL